MDLNVAARALPGGLEAEARMGHVDGLRSGVAFQAELALLAPFQQVEVDGAVRRVANGTSFHQYGSVLIRKWPLLFHVAGSAYVGSGALQFPSRKRAVRVVAIGALERTFIDPMPDWKLKLRLDLPVAGITELRLFLAQQAIIQPIVLRGTFGNREIRFQSRGRFGYILPYIQPVEIVAVVASYCRPQVL